MKSVLFKLPEPYLILLAIFTGYTPPFFINPIFVGIVVLLVFQIFIQHKVIGLATGVLFLLMNLYFIGALVAEFMEFTEFNSSAKGLLFTGLLIWIINVFVSATMIYKYSNPIKIPLAKFE